MELQKLQVLFGETIRELRQSKNIAQEKLAHLAGIDRTYMSAIERGLKNPSLKIIFQLADGLEMNASIIIEELEARISRSE
jgi:transcriptional regulator with XRE-family HTH domain